MVFNYPCYSYTQSGVNIVSVPKPMQETLVLLITLTSLSKAVTSDFEHSRRLCLIWQADGIFAIVFRDGVKDM